MKKVIALILALLLLSSMGTAVFAADTQTFNGTGTTAATPQLTVSYTGTGTESYTVTVPASIDLSTTTSGTVSVSGTWPSSKTLTVTCPDKVTMTHSYNSDANKELAVTFPGITKAGSNTETVSASATLTVGAIDKALFGTWTGTVEFTVTCEGKTYSVDISGLKGAMSDGWYLKADGEASRAAYDLQWLMSDGWYTYDDVKANGTLGRDYDGETQLNVKEFFTLFWANFEGEPNCVDCRLNSEKSKNSLKYFEITGDHPSISGIMDD